MDNEKSNQGGCITITDSSEPIDIKEQYSNGVRELEIPETFTNTYRPPDASITKFQDILNTIGK